MSKENSRWDDWNAYPQVHLDPEDAMVDVQEIVNEGVVAAKELKRRICSCTFKPWTEDGKGGWKWSRAHFIPTMEKLPSMYLLSPDFLRAFRRGIEIYARQYRSEAEVAISQFYSYWYDIFACLGKCIDEKCVRSAKRHFNWLLTYVVLTLIEGEKFTERQEAWQREKFDRFRLRMQKIALLLFDADNAGRPDRHRILFRESAKIGYSDELYVLKCRHKMWLWYRWGKCDPLAISFIPGRIAFAALTVIDAIRIEHPVYTGEVKQRNTVWSPSHAFIYRSAFKSCIEKLCEVLQGSEWNKVYADEVRDAAYLSVMMLRFLCYDGESAWVSQWLGHMLPGLADLHEMRDCCGEKIWRKWIGNWCHLALQMIDCIGNSTRDAEEIEEEKVQRKFLRKGAGEVEDDREKLKAEDPEPIQTNCAAMVSEEKWKREHEPFPSVEIGTWASAFVKAADQNAGVIMFKRRIQFYVSPTARKCWDDLRKLLGSADPQGWTTMKTGWQSKFTKKNKNDDVDRNDSMYLITRHFQAEERGRTGTKRYRICGSACR